MVDCHARPSPAMGLQFAKALEPYGLYFFEEPCWPESVDGLAAINARGHDADRDRRAGHESGGVPRPVRRRGPARSASSTSRTAAASPKRAASRRWPRRIASRSRRTIRKGPVSTAASLEFGFSQPSYIICETVHADVPWRQDVVQEGFTVETAGPHRPAEHAAGPGHHDQRSRSEEAPVRAGTAAAGVLSRRQRGRLVMRREFNRRTQTSQSRRGTRG